MRKPFILSESVEAKRSKTKFLSWKKRGHIDYTFRIIQTKAKLLCSKAILFRRLQLGSLPLFILSYLSVFIHPSVPKSWICKGKLEAKRCLLPNFLGHSPVKKLPIKEKAVWCLLGNVPGIVSRWVPSVKPLSPSPPFVNILPAQLLLWSSLS